MKKKTAFYVFAQAHHALAMVLIIGLLLGCAQDENKEPAAAESPANCECNSKPEVELQVFKKDGGTWVELNGFMQNGSLSIPATARNSDLKIVVIAKDDEGLLDADFEYLIYEYCQKEDGNQFTYGTIQGQLQKTRTGSNPVTQIVGELEFNVGDVKIDRCTDGGYKSYHRRLEVYGVATNICGDMTRTPKWIWIFRE